MPDVYRTRFVPREQPDTLVVHCSDPRYQAHFQEFLREHAGQDTYELIAVPGGPQFLTLGEYLPKFSWAGWRWMKFLVDVAKPATVILIAHESCRWYADMRFRHRHGDARMQQLEDLRLVCREVGERFPGVSVKLYYARMQDGHVVFESV